MAPKKKLTKKEKTRLEAEQAELLRQEMEKDRLRKLEEERQRKLIELEQAKRRQLEEIKENKERRAQLKHCMVFFNAMQQTIDAIKHSDKEQRDWEQYMRCNGLPNANSPSDLRKYLHQWRSAIEQRDKDARNWLLRTNERTLLTHDSKVPDLSRAALRRQQGNLGDDYAGRIKEVLGILNELDEVLADAHKPTHTIEDLKRLKTEIRAFLNDHLDEFSYKTMSHIERDMEIDRPGVSKHIYISDVFKSHTWTYSKDAQIAVNPKARIGEQTTYNEINFPTVQMEITLPNTVPLQSSTMRGLWLNYDHFSDYCPSYNLKKPRPTHINILMQTKREWHKRKEILQSMFDDCSKESPISHADSTVSQKTAERSYDVDKLYSAYEDELNKARRRAIGPEAFGLQPTDVNLRKYRIIGGVYCIDQLETPQQDKRLNARSFIRTIIAPDRLSHKAFYQTYTPPPPVQPGVRRLPEEIEAEMRMIETALDKLALVTVQLSDSVIWFEPPVPCRWETQMETLESELTAGVKPPPPATATPTENTPLSTTTNTSPLKSSPRFPARLRKRSSQKSASGGDATLPVRQVYDFDMLHMPSGIDIYGLLRDFVVPRLPHGFGVPLLQQAQPTKQTESRPAKVKPAKKKQQRFIFLARHKSINATQAATEQVADECGKAEAAVGIDERYLELNEPREFFPIVKFEKLLVFKERQGTEVTLEKEGPKEKQQADRKVSTNGGGIGGQGSVQGSSKASISSGSTKSASVEQTKTTAGRTYMFSQLIADLDRLVELQQPMKEQAIKQIATNLTAAALSAGPEKEEPANEPETMEGLHAGFDYYSGISFVRNLEANNEQKHDDEAAEQQQEEHESSSECEDDFDEAEYFGMGADDDKLETADRESANDIHDFLNKHNQSESVGSDGKNAKIANALALRQGKWSTRDVHDTKFNEDKFSIQFRSGRLGIFGFAMNRYSNMPYQTWEIKPEFKSPASILFSFTASIVSLDMNITYAGYCLNNFQGGSTEAISNMIGRTISLDELKATLISSAVDIFPDEDAFCYTEGSCEKNYVMEMHLYECMSTLGLSHNFSWSRWNLLAGSRTAVLLFRELIEGKKVPYHSTLLVTPLKAAIIDCTEVSASFNAVGIPGMAYYANLYQLMQVYALPSSLAKQREMEPVLRDNVARILMAIRPLSFC